jgi:hypothetical protein
MTSRNRTFGPGRPRQPWEDDFEKPDFWTRKAPPAKQGRVQLDSSRNLPCPTVLHVFCSAGLCLIDTCSDVSLARRDVLHSLQRVVKAALTRSARLSLEGDRRPPVTLFRVFAVDDSSLPAGVVALLGVADIQLLGLSLDAIAEKPGCHWEQARLSRGFARSLSDCWNWLTSCCKRRHTCAEPPFQLPRTRSPQPRAPMIDASLNGPPPVMPSPQIDASLNGPPPLLPAPQFLAELRAKSLWKQVVPRALIFASTPLTGCPTERRRIFHAYAAPPGKAPEVVLHPRWAYARHMRQLA